MLYADTIVPEKMYQYLIENNMTGLATFQSGVVTPSQAINELISGGGTIFNIPYFSDLGTDSTVLEDVTGLVPTSLTPFQQDGTIHFRGRGFKASELAASTSGSDPIGAIQSGLLRYWDKEFNKVLINTASGVLSDERCSVINDQSSSVISDELVIDTMALVGESQNDFVAIAMHPAVYAKLRKLDLIDTVVPSTGNPFSNYMGMRVILDSTLVDDDSVYTTILFKAGAFAYGENPAGITPIELDRDASKGIDIIYSRRRFILHPQGWSWTGTAAGVSPTNTELSTGTNWEEVFQVENLGFAGLKAKIAS